jgi:hypothetical protein
MTGRAARALDWLCGNEMGLLRYRPNPSAGYYTVFVRWAVLGDGRLLALSQERWPTMLRTAQEAQLRRDGSWRPINVTVARPTQVADLMQSTGITHKQPAWLPAPAWAVVITLSAG